jgi:hypothetical protein
MGVDVEAIKARLAAATPGPWWYDAEHGAVCSERVASGEYLFVVNELGSYTKEAEDGEFIAHSPADIAALLAENEALREEKVQLLGTKNVTIQTPPIPESECVAALQEAVLEWQLEAQRLKKLVASLQLQASAAVDDYNALRARLTLTDAMVEQAAKEVYFLGTLCKWEDASEFTQRVYREDVKMTLLAAGMGAERPGVAGAERPRGEEVKP